MIWNKTKKENVKRAETKKLTTGFTVLLIPNSSDAAKTIEISFDRILQVFTAAVAVAIIIIGLVISMMVHNHKLKKTIEEARADVTELTETNTALEDKITSLNEQIDADREVFSKIEDTISKKEEEVAALSEEAAIPGEVPIKNADAILVEDPYADSEGGATMGLVFSTVKGALVVAAGDGEVIHVDSDEENPFYKKGIVVDHGNGYITYYRLNGEVSVEEGARVSRQDVMAVLDNDGYVAYEVKKDGEFV
ncbi:MAG: peptidoglycan DD-metalloendopeptidase family protein, partial [Lachnospiraceae bacterium]|nr:peptidoglycan DD-metalloendopeptidase family protein [Lachnospiraceae bacterium]